MSTNIHISICDKLQKHTVWLKETKDQGTATKRMFSYHVRRVGNTGAGATLSVGYDCR